jgi:HK97 family phage major capsid protein
MNKILELREKRAKLWESAKAFLDARRDDKGLVSVEDTATYERMEQDVVDLGKEIDRLEKQAVLDLELSKPTSTPLSNKPNNGMGKIKEGRASDEYKKAFWNVMRTKNP